MSIDYLRKLAFSGELSHFFREDPYELAQRGANGIGLQFSARFMRFVAHTFRTVRGYEENAVENWYQQWSFSVFFSDVLDVVDGGPDAAFTEKYGLSGWVRDLPDRRKIVNIVIDVGESNNLFTDGPRDYEGYAIKYRISPPISGQFSRGDAISNAQTQKVGTICGFLGGTNISAIFALTCGHVGHLKGDNIENLGIVIDVITPMAHSPCNRYATPNSNSVDAALIEVSQTAIINMGPSCDLKPITMITPGDLIEFRGRGGRGRRPARVCSATIWKQIDLYNDGNLNCCGDIFEIGHRAPVYVQSSLSRPGDSGAAILRNGQPDEWFGMLIGGSGSSSYASYAEHILDWAAGLYPNIKLLP